MKDDLKVFSINDINMFKDDDDVDFAIAEIAFISDGDNGQNSPITKEAVYRDAKSVLGKPVVAKYHKYKGDVGTHELDEVIVGWVPRDSEVKFKEYDGKVFAICEAVISKLYATEVFMLFKGDNYRSVSCEFSANQPNPNEYGEGEIIGFDIRAITILGKSVAPAIKDANIQIKKFSEKDANEYYEKINNPLKEFAEERRGKMLETKTYKINKTELKETSWGDVNKSTLRDAVMKAKNRDRLVNSVYLLVEDGWEDSPSEHLKYPVMQLVDDTFYYNRNGMASAYGFAKSEGEDEVIAKLKKLYKKFKLDIPGDDSDRKEDEKKMAEKKFSELEGREIYGEVIKRVQSKLGKDMYVESIYNDHIEVKNGRGETLRIPADIKVGKDDEKISISIDYDKMKKFSEEEDKKDEKKFEDPDKVEEEVDEDLEKDEHEGDHGVKKASKDDPDELEEEADKEISKEEKKMSEDKEEDEDKEFSLNEDVDAGATFERLVEETKTNKELSEEDKKLYEELWSSKKPDLIMEHMSKMSKELAELRQFKSKTDAKECEMEFKKEMSKVKGKIDEKDYKEFYEKGEKIKDKEKMKEFSLELRSFAWDVVTDEKDSPVGSVMRYAGVTRDNSNKTQNVFDRISSK